MKLYLASGTRLAYAPLSSNFAMAILCSNQVATISVLNGGGNVVAFGGGQSTRNHQRRRLPHYPLAADAFFKVQSGA